MRVDKWNEIAEDHRLRATRYRAAVIALHGMKTTGKWQKDLVPDFQDKGIRCMLIDYGFLVVGVLFRKRRLRVIKDILAAYREQRRHAARVTAVAHSFGSLTLMEAIAKRKRLRFPRIILYGCIVSRRYAWDAVHANGRVDRVLHETSRRDLLPRLAPFVIPDSGASGATGFKDCPAYVQEMEYPRAKHSGLQFRAHYRCVWIPFLLS